MDVIRSNVNVGSIDDKERYKSTLTKLKTEMDTESLKDSVAIASEAKQDMIRIREMQNNYLKSEVSLNGLVEMEKVVSEFEDSGMADTFSELSRQLHNVSSETSFNGESIISYLSTEIRDEKGLYTFKMNLESEIGGIREQLASERKQIASYLVEAENKETASGFDAERMVNTIRDMLAVSDTDALIGKVNNVNSLLISES